MEEEMEIKVKICRYPAVAVSYGHGSNQKTNKEMVTVTRET